MSGQVQGQGRNKAVTMYTYFSPQLCGPVAQDYLMLPSL